MHLTKRPSLLALLLATLGALIGGENTVAQTSLTATIQSPTAGQTNVSLTPTIMIVTNMAIDNGSITYQAFHRAEGDPPDTTFPSIFLVEKDRYDTCTNLHNLTPIPGIYQLVTSTKLTFKPYRLENGQKYVVIVKNLRAYTGVGPSPYGYDKFPPTQTVFSTVNNPHRLVATSVYPGEQVNCSDIIYAVISRRTDSTTTAMSSVLKVRRVDSTVVVNDSVAQQYTSVVSGSYRMSDSGTTIFFTPSSPLSSSESYYLDVKLSQLTGDTNSNHRVPFTVRQYGQIETAVAPVNPADSLPSGCILFNGVGETSYRDGDQLEFIAMPRDSGYRFKQWVCPQDPSLDGLTTPTLHVIGHCSSLGYRKLTALYEPIPIDTLVVGCDSNGSLRVYDKDFTLLGGAGSYTVRQGDPVVVVAVTDSGRRFVGWHSGDVRYDGLSQRAVEVYTKGGKLTLKGEIKKKEGADTVYALCGGKLVRGEGSDPNGMSVSGCSESDEVATGEVSGVAARGYKIVGYIDAVGVEHGVHPGVGSLTVSGRTASAPNVITMIVEPERYELFVEKALADAGPGGARKPLTEELESYATITPLGEYVQSENDPSLMIFRYDQGTNVLVEARRTSKEGYGFQRWFTDAGYYYLPGQEGGATMTVAMIGDEKLKKVGIEYHESFYLDAIGTRNSGNVLAFRDPKLFPVEDLLVDAAKTPITLRFNRPVDPSSVEGAIHYMVYPRVSAALPGGSGGGVVSQMRRLPSVAGSFEWSGDHTELTFKIGKIGKMQSFIVSLDQASIKSQAGTPWGNAVMRFSGITLFPGLTVKIKKIQLNVDSDDDFVATNDPDVYTIYTGVSVNPGRADLTWTGRFPTGDGSGAYNTMHEGTSVDYDLTVFTIDKLHRDDIVALNAAAIDVDDADSYKKVGWAIAAAVAVAGGLVFLGIIPGGEALSKALIDVASRSRRSTGRRTTMISSAAATGHGDEGPSSAPRRKFRGI